MNKPDSGEDGTATEREMRSCKSCGDTGTRRWRVSVDEWDSDECPDCRPLGTCHVTDCYNAAVGGEIGESGDLLLCAEHLREGPPMTDRDEYERLRAAILRHRERIRSLGIGQDGQHGGPWDRVLWAEIEATDG